MSRREKAATVFSLASFVVGIGFFTYLVKHYEVDQYEHVFTLVGAIIAFITLFGLVVATIITLRQLREASNARMLSALPSVFSERIHNQTSAIARRKLYTAYYNNSERFNLPHIWLTDELLGCCQQVFYDYSELGSFIHYGLLDKKYAEDVLHANPARMWFILKNYAKREANQRGYEDYLIPFKRIAVIGIEYWFKAQHYEHEKDGLRVYNHGHAKSRLITRPELREELRTLKKEIKEYESYKRNSERKLHSLIDRGEEMGTTLTVLRDGLSMLCLVIIIVLLAVLTFRPIPPTHHSNELAEIKQVIDKQLGAMEQRMITKAEVKSLLHELEATRADVRMQHLTTEIEAIKVRLATTSQRRKSR